MRRTKAFSCNAEEYKIFGRLKTLAKKNHRTESGQLVLILKDYFSVQEEIKKINCRFLGGTGNAKSVTS